MHGAKGGIAAGALFVLPSAFLLFGLSWIYMAGGHLPWLASIFHGLLGAVIAVVADAVLRIGKRSLRTTALCAIAIASFSAIYAFNISFVLILVGSALLGGFGPSSQFPSVGGHGKAKDRVGMPLPAPATATISRALWICATCVGGRRSSESPHGLGGRARMRSRDYFSVKPPSSPLEVRTLSCRM